MPWVFSHTCCFSRVRSSTSFMLAMAGGTAATTEITGPVTGEAHSDLRGARLWSLVARGHQRRRVHDIRIQLHAPENSARLALLWRLHRLPGRAVHGDVRLPPDDLPVFRMASAALPRDGPPDARQRAPLGDAARLARGPAPEPAAPPQQRPDRGRLHPAGCRLAGPLRGPAGTPAGDQWTLCPRAPSAVRGVHPHHGRVPGAVADHTHARNVPDPRLDVRASGAARGGRGPDRVRRDLRALCCGDAG